MTEDGNVSIVANAPSSSSASAVVDDLDDLWGNRSVLEFLSTNHGKQKRKRLEEEPHL